MADQPQNTDPKTLRPIEYGARPTMSSPWSEMAHHFRRWSRDTFTRENVVSNLKTLAWVVPLTFLVWVYAEREQISTYKDEPLPFELVSLDPNRTVTLSRGDKNLIVDLQGPQARVQDVLQKIRGGQNETPRGIRLEVDPSLPANKEHEINAAALLRSQKIFSDYGLTVLGCQPAWLLVKIDELVERDAKVTSPPSIKNLEGSSAFDPPVVKIRGPKSKLDEAAAQNNNQLVVYADIPDDVLKTAGHRNLAEVTLQRPTNLLDDRIVIATTQKVKASLDVRAADVTGKIDSMPIFLEFPDAVAQKIESGQWKVDRNVFKPYLGNVHVVGPKEIIDRINLPEFAPRPKATIEVSTSDVGEAKPKTLRYELPKGVEVADEDMKRTVDFRLIDRSSGE
jgi:hypothetical protein